MKLLLSTFIILLTFNNVYSQSEGFSFSAEVVIGQEVSEQFKEDGRIYLFLSKNPNAEPYTQTWPSPIGKTTIFAKNMTGVKNNESIKLAGDDDLISTDSWSLDQVPAGEYFVQVLWDQDTAESRIDAPGNLYSETQKVNIDGPIKLKLTINKSIEERVVTSHELSREVDMKSDVLSSWWGKPMHLKASILLPSGYDSKKAYPIRYNVAGYGGRYTRINHLLSNPMYMEWWESEESPQIITVFLDGEGPFGDSYQMDSENSGPYGEALITEFIPYIEAEYRGTDAADTRFVDGCSTGGWVSLGLQLYYPDSFNGSYSYSPDAVEFSNYQLIDIYNDENAYINEYGHKRPVMRSTDGEPMVVLQDFIQYENVLGTSNTYLNSGGQFSAHTALYSPRGKDGLPQPLFDPVTGDIDAQVAELWRKYDFMLYAEDNWEDLGPKLQSKLYIWMGDMDHFYLNPATREFADFLDNTTNPKSDAVIEFTPMSGHCTEYSHIDVLNQMQKRVDSLK